MIISLIHTGLFFDICRSSTTKKILVGALAAAVIIALIIVGTVLAVVLTRSTGENL
jgi:hypothetical protein